MTETSTYQQVFILYQLGWSDAMIAAELKLPIEDISDTIDCFDLDYETEHQFHCELA
jgi:hypothetical protein